MTSRRLLAAAALGGLALAGCGAADRDAASVDGRAVSVDDYESLLTAFAAEPELTQLVEDPLTGTVPGDDARRWLTLMVQGAASAEFLERAGQEVTEEDRQAVLEQVDPEDPVLDFDDDIVTLLIDQQAATTARTRIGAPDDLAARYERAPRGLGVVCVRHVLVETEAEAADIAAEVRAGADIGELAAERSIDPAAAGNGGAIEGPDGAACLPAATAAQQLDPAFFAAASSAGVGETVGPIPTDFGWHVIQARPWDEVGESVDVLFEQAAGDLLFTGFLATADVHVDPRYGRWDATTSTVVAL